MISRPFNGQRRQGVKNFVGGLNPSDSGINHFKGRNLAGTQKVYRLTRGQFIKLTRHQYPAYFFGRVAVVTPIRLSRLTKLASSSAFQSSVPLGRIGSTM